MGRRTLPAAPGRSMTDDFSSSSPTEAELTRAEAELASREQQLLAQVEGAQQEVQQLGSLLASLRDRLESSVLEDAAEVLGEFQDTAVPGLEVGTERARALELRRQALAVRKERSEEHTSELQSRENLV